MAESNGLPTRRFGKTGFDVSILGFGAAVAAFTKAEAEATARLVNLLLDEGLNLIDTALMYPGSEAFIGEHLAHRRDEYFLVSKCGQKHADLPGDAWSPQNVTAAVDRALRVMKTDRLDLMLLHSCDLPVLQQDDALGALVDARDAGKLRHVGYSGDNDALAFAAELPDVAVIETSVNVVDQANIDHGLAVAKHNDVGVIVKRPIANACWRPAETRTGIYVKYVQPYADRLAAMNLDPEAIGFTHDDYPELFLRFTLSQPGVHTAIVGTTSEANARRNLQYARKGPLSDEQVEHLRDAFDSGRGPDGWPGLT